MGSETAIVMLITFIVNTGIVYGTDKPIIGIVELDISAFPPSTATNVSKFFGYIPASYVRLVEMGGARVVPLHIGQTPTYYQTMFNQINGLLLVGESQSLSFEDSLYSTAARQLYDLSVKANNDGEYFPVLGISLGAEMLLTKTATENSDAILTACEARQMAVQSKPTRDFGYSRLYFKMPRDVYSQMLLYQTAYHNHSVCLTPQTLKNSSLNTVIKGLTESQDNAGVAFISTFEDRRYPFYGLHWHPEKVSFDWGQNTDTVPRTGDATRYAQFVANFIVNEARGSSHRFKTANAEKSALIYNFPTTYTTDVIYDQVYLIKKQS